MGILTAFVAQRTTSEDFIVKSEEHLFELLELEYIRAQAITHIQFANGLSSTKLPQCRCIMSRSSVYFPEVYFLAFLLYVVVCIHVCERAAGDWPVGLALVSNHISPLYSFQPQIVSLTNDET